MTGFEIIADEREAALRQRKRLIDEGADGSRERRGEAIEVALRGRDGGLDVRRHLRDGLAALPDWMRIFLKDMLAVSPNGSPDGSATPNRRKAKVGDGGRG